MISFYIEEDKEIVIQNVQMNTESIFVYAEYRDYINQKEYWFDTPCEWSRFLIEMDRNSFSIKRVVQDDPGYKNWNDKVLNSIANKIRENELQLIFSRETINLKDLISTKEKIQKHYENKYPNSKEVPKYYSGGW